MMLMVMMMMMMLISVCNVPSPRLRKLLHRGHVHAGGGAGDEYIRDARTIPAGRYRPVPFPRGPHSATQHRDALVHAPRESCRLACPEASPTQSPPMFHSSSFLAAEDCGHRRRSHGRAAPRLICRAAGASLPRDDSAPASEMCYTHGYLDGDLDSGSR